MARGPWSVARGPSPVNHRQATVDSRNHRRLSPSGNSRSSQDPGTPESSTARPHGPKDGGTGPIMPTKSSDCSTSGRQSCSRACLWRVFPVRGPLRPVFPRSPRTLAHQSGCSGPMPNFARAATAYATRCGQSVVSNIPGPATVPAFRPIESPRTGSVALPNGWPRSADCSPNHRHPDSSLRHRKPNVPKHDQSSK